MPTGQPDQHRRESATSEWMRGDYALAPPAEPRQQYPERRRARRRWMARRLGVGRTT
jgi:hypothetical protein